MSIALLVAYVEAARKDVRNRKYNLSKKDLSLFKEWLKDRPEKVRKLKLSQNELRESFRKFKVNLKKVRDLNSKLKGKVEFGLTDLSDLEHHEFKNKFANLVVPSSSELLKRSVEEVTKRSIEALPASFDWYASPCAYLFSLLCFSLLLSIVIYLYCVFPSCELRLAFPRCLLL